MNAETFNKLPLSSRHVMVGGSDARHLASPRRWNLTASDRLDHPFSNEPTTLRASAQYALENVKLETDHRVVSRQSDPISKTGGATELPSSLASKGAIVEVAGMQKLECSSLARGIGAATGAIVATSRHDAPGTVIEIVPCKSSTSHGPASGSSRSQHDILNTSKPDQERADRDPARWRKGHRCLFR